MDNNATIQKTDDYDQFNVIGTNRDVNRGHIERIKQAYEDYGNLTKVQPILVNERFQIIDGQHRFIASKDLGQPIYYTMVEGLGVAEARSMNILHRGWTIDDYAKSYANGGDSNYRKYLEIKDDYGFNHSITLTYIHGTDDKGIWKDFREGEFVLEDEEGARDRLSKLAEVGLEVAFVNDRYFAKALLVAMKIEGYDHKRMLRKLALHQNLLERKATVADYLRLLEAVYNHQVGEANRVRLY